MQLVNQHQVDVELAHVQLQTQVAQALHLQQRALQGVHGRHLCTGRGGGGCTTTLITPAGSSSHGYTYLCAPTQHYEPLPYVDYTTTKKTHTKILIMVLVKPGTFKWLSANSKISQPIQNIASQWNGSHQHCITRVCVSLLETD